MKSIIEQWQPGKSFQLDAQINQFLQQHLDDMAHTAPAESQHALALDSYKNPAVTLLVCLASEPSTSNNASERRAEILGTVAFKLFDHNKAELKTMRTNPAVRGQGIAQKLLREACTQLAQQNVTHLYLETGTHEFFKEAQTLYTKNSFQECPPFGNYTPDPHSVFMVKELTH